MKNFLTYWDTKKKNNQLMNKKVFNSSWVIKKENQKINW